MKQLWLRLAFGIGGTLLVCWIFAGMVFERVLPDEFEQALLRLMADDISRAQRVGRAARHEDFGYAIRLETTAPGAEPVVIKHFGEPPEIWVPILEGAVVLVPALDATPPPGVIALVFLTVVLVVSAVGWMLGAPLVRRLTILGDAARRFGEGDNMARAHLPPGDAVGDVAVQFDRMAARIGALLTAQDHLLQAVSHELRTPAARIRFALELLADADTDEKRRRLVSSIDDDVAELDELIDELLTWVRLGLGLPADACQSVDAAGMTERLVRESGMLRSDIQLSVQCAPKVVLRADPRQYARVVRNLVGNALKYATQRVEVRLAHGKKGRACLIVEDDGTGIPASERDRVFEPFVRIGEKGHGAGLGLAIVQRAVLAHGGSVTIEDAPLGGVRLVVEWPLEAPESAPAQWT